jgi:hypothetical protein
MQYDVMVQRILFQQIIPALLGQSKMHAINVYASIKLFYLFFNTELF